jgi:hypothetical protein
MAQLPLIGGYRVARSAIADTQRCTNLYPERNREPDAPDPYTLYPTPGLTAVGAVPEAGTWRGLYTATNRKLYGVLNQNVYYIDANWVATPIGGPLTAPAQTPVKFADNGQNAVIVDGSPQGYTIDLATNAVAQIGDPNFLGGTHAGFLDTFLLFNQPGTRNFYSSLSNQVAFDGTYLAAKSGYPDALAGLIVMHRELWLFGNQQGTEVWYNAGGAAFPFAISPGIYIEHGCIAPYSIAKSGDLVVFWLGTDIAGNRTVYMGAGYTAKRISDRFVSDLLRKLPRVDDAIGMTYQQQDHTFYVLTFPSSDVTLACDITEDFAWHQRSWLDVNGVEHRHRMNCIANAYGSIVCGDYANGQLYTLDLDNYTDAGAPIVRRRGFRHIVADGNQFAIGAVRLNMECGTVFATGGSPWSLGFSPGFGPPGVLSLDEVYLRVSLDRGKSYGQPVGQTLGGTGNTLVQPQWRNMGLSRDAVLEVFWASPVATALQGAWLDSTPAMKTRQGQAG